MGLGEVWRANSGWFGLHEVPRRASRFLSRRNPIRGGRFFAPCRTRPFLDPELPFLRADRDDVGQILLTWPGSTRDLNELHALGDPERPFGAGAGDAGEPGERTDRAGTVAPLPDLLDDDRQKRPLAFREAAGERRRHGAGRSTAPPAKDRGGAIGRALVAARL